MARRQFAARAGLRTLVLDADKGMTRRAQLNNLLGYRGGITGPELVERSQPHARRAGADWQSTEATALQPADDIVRLTTSDGGTFDADQVLLTTGASAALAHEVGVATRPATEPRMKEAIVVDEQGRTNVRRLWAAGAAAGASVHVIITARDGARVTPNRSRRRCRRRAEAADRPGTCRQTFGTGGRDLEDPARDEPAPEGQADHPDDIDRSVQGRMRAS
jgi:thioredoxin reductase (NADPH)